MEEFSTRLVCALVGVSAKVIPLGLEKVSWQDGIPVAVEEGECGAERRDRDAALCGGGHNIAPALLGVFHLAAEVVVEQEVRELGIAIERLLDLAEEA